TLCPSSRHLPPVRSFPTRRSSDLFRRLPQRRGAYIGAALVLALGTYADVHTAARQSTDRWLVDTRRLLQEAATRMPAPRTRVSRSEEHTSELQSRVDLVCRLLLEK